MEEEQLKTSLNVGNFRSQFPSLPESKENEGPDQQHSSCRDPDPNKSNPQKDKLYSTTLKKPNKLPTEPSQDSTTEATTTSNSNQPPQQPPPTQPKLNKDELSFLVLTIKEILKDDINKEMEAMKQKINLCHSLAQVNPLIQKPNSTLFMPQVQNLAVNPNHQLHQQLLNASPYNLQISPQLASH